MRTLSRTDPLSAALVVLISVIIPYNLSTHVQNKSVNLRHAKTVLNPNTVKDQMKSSIGRASVHQN